MSAAAPLPHSASTRRQQQQQQSSQQQQAYNGTLERDRPHRSQSQAVRQTSTSSPRRSMSTSQAPPSSSHGRAHSSNLDRVARQDVEQSNLAQPPHAARRSDSRDRPINGAQPHPPRMESVRSSSGHARTQSRYSDQPVPAPTYESNAQPSEGRTTSSVHNRRRTTIDTQTGHWDLGKTIGAGSMGKVKLARNKETGEQVAVKIVPRQSTEGEHRTPQERERADHSKEIRTAREAAIVTLVDHPYICGMRDVIRTNYHWYMLFEYVNGGQMLDYIISHGRLKEKQARKFGRQIASALDYCHRNSIVHRDLKIENILISKTGDIKIIDFGLSNLFSPRSHLKTFCGSLYFAAPELLQAKLYTGPEVDVWSFGIVLYVLVCGKVPFDDQSMPQLHAKIKKGVVEYPPWLTPECRGLIARMLTTNPSERATLQEIMTHPWMNRGFNGPPESYLPARKPLQLPLDPAIIDKMTGFDFGESELITSQLTKIIESDDYQRAIRLSERRSYHPPPDVEQRRGVFNFYKRRSSVNSKDTLSSPSIEALQLGIDPLNAFHPLISIYYLAQEKMEREAREKNPGAITMPQAAGDKPLPIPDLPAPEAAHTNTQTYEMAGEKPTGGRSRPRARTHGEDEVAENLKNMNINAVPSPVNPTIIEPPAEQKPAGHNRKESTAAGLLRRLSTRRSKEPGDRERPSHPPSALAAYSANEGPRKSFSMRRPRDRDSSMTREREPSTGRSETGVSSKRVDMLTPPLDDVIVNEKPKRTHGLGRSISVNSSDMRRRFSRRGVSEGSSMRPPMSSGSPARAPSFEQSGSLKEPASDVETTQSASGVGPRTKSMGHVRKESMQVRRARRNAHRTSDVPEETDQEMIDEVEGQNNDSSSPTGMKPVYLKGLFSVSTTSSRPLSFIRSDIIRVLKQLGVEYKEIKGGFSCRHAPSIMAQPPADETAPSGAQALSQPTDSNHRRKISFGGFRDRERDEVRSQPPTTPRPKASFVNSEDESDEDPPASHPRSAATRPAGETSTHVQTDLGRNMTLRFEIFVVKVPLLSLHGIQFKKVNGGTWQYKNMAQKILNELRL